MGKVYLSQFNFKDYKGAENINILYGYTPNTSYLEDYSVVESNGFYLSQDEPNEFNYTLSTESSADNIIYLNSNLSSMFKDLTNLYHTDVINKTKINYHYVTNMHTMFANCFRLFEVPISGKYVKSMYGTYYNGTNLYGAPAMNNNVQNCIGTYYNCQNITSANINKSVTTMVDTYFNCTNLTGYARCSDNVKSLYNAYYNCYLLSGSPANCNNASITINAYYNCPNMYGNIYWWKKDSPFADCINATNMFYNRNCDRWLNIYVYPGRCIFNALVNHSDTYGNIYGVGALTWTQTTGMYGKKNYVNDLYRTRIVEYFYPIYISGYTFNNYVYGNYFWDESWNEYKYNCNIHLFNGVYNSTDELPNERYSSAFRVEYLNSSAGVIIWRRWLNIIQIIPGNSYYSRRNYTFNMAIDYVITNNKDPETICWSSCPQIQTVNDFDYPGYFNLDYIAGLNYIYDIFSFRSNQIVVAKCHDNATIMNHTYYYNLTGYLNPYNNGKEIPSWIWENLNNVNSPFYKALNTDYFTRYINLPTNVTIRPACGNNVTTMLSTYKNWKLDTQPVSGINVRYMTSTYENCRGIINPACGDNVVNFIQTYYNTDVKNPYFGPNVKNSYRAYGYTNVTAENVKLLNTITNFQYTYRNCINLQNIENLDFQGIINAAGCFLGCTNLRIEEETNLIYPSSFNTFSHMFYGCSSINYPMPLPYDRYSIPNMSHSYAGCSSLKTLRDKAFTANNFNATFAWCNNLTTGADKVYFTNDTYDINYIFAGCGNLQDDIDWRLPQNHYMNMEGCFQNCFNINYINIYQGDYECMIGCGMFKNCTNVKNIAFYPSYNNGEIYVNFDYLFSNCSNLNYLLGVTNLNGYRAEPPVSPGDTSSTINYEQDLSYNNCFSQGGGQGGYLFFLCRNLKYLPNFICGGYIGPCSFYYCNNIPQINFFAGDDLSWATYAFLRGQQFYYCQQLHTILFDKVRYLNFNGCNSVFDGCNNLTNIILQNYTHYNINVSLSYNLVTYCNNLNYLFKCNILNHQYYYNENEIEEYQDLYPVRFFFNQCYNSYSTYDQGIVHNCNSFIDMCNCPYLFNIRHFSSNNTLDNFFRYCNNLRGLIINSNYCPTSFFTENIGLTNLNYLHIELDETLGYSNWSRAIQISNFLYFKRNSQTQLTLNYLTLGFFNRWTGSYYNITNNSTARENKRSEWGTWLVNNLFKNTNFTTINLLFLDDRIDESLLSNTRSYFNGAMRYTSIVFSNHFFNKVFNNCLRGVSNINSLILSPHAIIGRSGNMSFEIFNIINSRTKTYLSDTPYNNLNNNFLPLEKIHCNYIYIGCNMNTTASSFNTNYITPPYTEAIYNFADIITNSSSVKNVSLMFGVEFGSGYRLDTLYPDDFTHQTKILSLNPSMININYKSTTYNVYTKGTLGSHIAYLGANHANAQYFGDGLTFTESKTLIAQYNLTNNIYQYNRDNLNIIRTNNLVTKFNFSPFDSISFNNFFLAQRGMLNAQTYNNLRNCNYMINLYEVDLANIVRNIHIKYIFEEISFSD